MVVVGGGTAGLEAACTAAEMGCRTVLLEQSDQLGGLASKISLIPEKKRITDFVTYQRNRASSLKNLEVRLGAEADLKTIESLSPDLVVAATGSSPLLPPIPGLKEELAKPGRKVHTIVDFLGNLDSFRDPAGKIVVIGGGAVGLDVAEYFAALGAKDVSIVEMFDAIARDVDFITKIDIRDMLSRPDAPKVFTSTTLRQVKADAFVVERNGETIEMPFDKGFVCLGMTANKPLEEELCEYCRASDIPMINIGDRRQARRIIDGVREGRDVKNVIMRLSEEKVA